MTLCAQHSDVSGNNVNVVQIVGDHNVVSIGNRPYLKLITAATRKDRVALRTELDLLVSYRCTLPLVGRVNEMNSLCAWRDSDARMVRFMVRTAQEFSHATFSGKHYRHLEPVAWINHLIDTAESAGSVNHNIRYSHDA